MRHATAGTPVDFFPQRRRPFFDDDSGDELCTPAMNAQTIVADGPEVDGVLNEADERDHYYFEAEANYEAEISGDVYVLVRVAGASGYPSLGEYRVRVLSVDPGPTD